MSWISSERQLLMPTIEERLQTLEQEHERLHVIEQEHTQLKKTIELQTIAIRALVSKEAFEKLQETVEKSQEQNNKLFDALMTHDHLTNERLGDIQSQITEQDGKIVGLQTEMRQRFNEHTALLTQILERLPKNEK
jgi:delta 1-pyrroline-5-carboxylate dehydrogenase